jgi:integrase
MKVIPSNSPGKPWRVIVPGRYSGTGKRKPFYFATKKEGEELIKSLKVQGRNALQSANPDHIAALRLISERLGGDLNELFRAVDFYLANRPQNGNLTLQAVVEMFIADQEHQGKKRKTVDTDRGRLKKFLAEFGHRTIGEVGQGDLVKWLLKHKPGTTRLGIYKAIHKFFGWAANSEIIKIDPMEKVKPMDTAGAHLEIMAPGDYHKLLQWCQANDKEMLAYFALAGLAGMRTCELVRDGRNDESLRWEDIKWDRGFIHVRGEVAKQTSRKAGNVRYIQNALTIAALKHWLKPFAGPEGYVVPFTSRTLSDRKAAALEAVKIEIPENALRNSFGSYFLTAGDGEAGVGFLSKEMGNSEAVAKRFYIMALEPQTGVAWFAVPAALPAPKPALPEAKTYEAELVVESPALPAAA